MTRRRFLQGTAAAGGLSLATGFYTWRIEPHWVQFYERELPVAGLPQSLVGARLAQLSDLHIGPLVDDDYLRSVFDRVRALKPEIVVYTGDFTTYDTDVVEHAVRMIPNLPVGSQATFGILGNHDYGPRWSRPDIADKIAELATSAGVQMLRNEVGVVSGLQVIGMDDIWGGRFDPSAAFAKMDSSLPAIALSHNPDSADDPGWDKYAGWILSGHTHGGPWN